MNKTTLSLAALALLSATSASFATEGGGSTYPVGAENHLAGAAPPPGVYVLEYVNVYSADRLNDGQGNAVPVPGFKVKANAAATRIAWVTTTPVMGGQLVAHAILPLVSVKVSAAGQSSSRSGLGDVSLGTGVAWHHSPQLHSVMALDLVLPVGQYDAARPVNIGRNYASLQPAYLVSWIDPAGFNADAKIGLNLNRTNKDTGYRSGNELNIDYALGWGLGNGWVLGVGGHLYQQLSDDRRNGETVAGNKGRSYAAGPNLKYDSGKGWFITAKLSKEFSVRSRTEGTSFWIKTTIPF
jgi:hypothetical protein